MNEEKIKEIFDDLYQIDPELKKFEKELFELVENMISSRPDIKMDKEFESRLRKKLFEEAKKLKDKGGRIAAGFWKKVLFGLDKKFVYSFIFFGILAIFSSALVALIYPGRDADDEGIKISRLKDGAFGVLNSASGENFLAGNSLGERAAGLGGGGQTIAMDSSAASPKAMSLSDSVESGSAVMPPYGDYEYEYVYQGEEFKLDDASIGARDGKMEVLRRIKGFSSSFDPSVLIGDNLVDLNSFSHTSLQNLSFAENKNDGLAVNINFVDGSLSIYENWIYWQDAAVDSSRINSGISVSNFPADEKIIAVADDFLKTRGINRAYYESGTVDDAWRAYYEKAEDKASVYVPEVISVLYPLNIGGREIYDQSGERDGLRVSVNIGKMKVSGVWTLYNQEYQSSFYPIEQDFEKVLTKASAISGYPILFRGAEGIEDGSDDFFSDKRLFLRKIKVELGTPKLEYGKFWNYSNGQSEELLVPVLIFPIANPDQLENFYRKNVIVPLVQDLLTGNGRYYEIMK